MVIISCTNMYRIDILLKQDQKLFHTSDLALLWHITNKNTLYTTIKRYVQKSILIPIHKGFYATTALEKLDPIRIASGYLHRYAYVSCETILAKNDIIFQEIPFITLVSDSSRVFSVAGHNYKVRRMKSAFLYNECGISNENGVL